MIERNRFSQLSRWGGLCFLLLILVLSGCTLLGNDVVVLSGSILFEDQFVRGQTGNWLTDTDVAGQSLVIDETLVIQVSEPNTVQYVTLQDPEFSDFILEFDVTQLEGSRNSTHGVLLRVTSSEQFYRFVLTGNGEFAVEKYMAGGGWDRLTDGWLETGAILRGNNQTNQVRIEAIGVSMVFYVNSQLVTQIVDPSYERGRIAFSAGTFGVPGSRVAFDNVMVRQP